MKLSIILPSYNEEKRLANALDELIIFLMQSGYEYEIIVSADGSTDDTEKIASEYAEKCENIFLVTFPERLGKGGGIINASRVATGDVLIIFDADLSVPPEQIHSTLKIMVNSSTSFSDYYLGYSFMTLNVVIKRSEKRHLILYRDI